MMLDGKRLFGVTHGTDGARIQRQVRVLKVGIGVPSQGPDVHVYITPQPEHEKPWCVEVGSYSGRSRSAKVQTFGTRAEAESFYTAARKGAPKCVMPRRLDYFTFSRPGMDGNVADFDAIEAHGAKPNEIDVVFLTDDPFDPQFAMYSQSELKCHGDGINALRKISMATAEQQPLVEIAKRKSEKYFAIVEGCYTKGCPYPKKGDCKPHARLYFQLSSSLFLRIGGTCSFETTGFRSIAQLDSCIDTIKTVTGRGDPAQGMLAGIPLKMVLRPYRTKYIDNQGNEKSSTQFAASLEYRAKSAVELARSMINNAVQFRDALQLTNAEQPLHLSPGSEPLRLAPAPDDIVVEAEPELTEEQLAADAAATSAEFYTEGEGQGEGYDFGEAKVTTNQMPRRRSEAGTQSTVAATATAINPAALVIAGVVFPDEVLAAEGVDGITMDQNTQLYDEADRIGTPLLTYCDEVLGLQPRELSKAAASALLQVMKQAPDRARR